MARWLIVPVALAAAAGVAALRPSPATPAPGALKPATRPLVIAHRGASGLRPEHTLAAYRLAVEQGADFLELDVVATRDGELVVRHDLDLAPTTDVADRPGFATKKTTRKFDGRKVTGWFVDELPLADVRELKTRQRTAARGTKFDGVDPVPTLAEVIALAAELWKDRGRAVGLFIETKHADHYRALGRPLEAPLVAVLKKHGLDRPDAPVILQSFDPDSLAALRDLTDLPRVLLLGGAGPFPPKPWDEIAALADGIGPDLRRLDDPELAKARTAGLKVYPWTFKEDADYSDPQVRAVDGVITDFPADAVAAFARRK